MRVLFLLGFFCEEDFVFRFFLGRFWLFELLFFVFVVRSVFFEQDFDATGDWDGDDCADNAEHVDADGDRSEDDESRELKAFALDFWRDDVRFDLEIDDCVDDEGETGAPDVEGEEKRNECTANE